MELNENASPETALDEQGFLKADESSQTPAQQPAPEVTDAPPKRRPGRPSNAEKAARAAGGAPKETPSASKAPGQKPQKRGEKMSSEKRGLLAKQLVGLHAVAAAATGLPELNIAPQEGEILAEGIAAVAEEYGLALDGKTGAALSLLGACAMIYAPRFFAVQSRMRKQQAQDAVIVN